MLFIRQFAVWSVVVWACALPIVALTWATFGVAERIGEVAGVIAWTIIVAIIAQRRQQRLVATARLLRTGALAVAAINLVAATIEPPFAMALLYAPAIRAASPIMDPLESHAGLSDFAIVFTLTLFCGAQAAAMAFGSGHLIARMKTLLTLPLRRIRL
jgi:hypothetical protein